MSLNECLNLGTANDFNIFVFGDHTQSFVDAEGRVAVGGTATYVGYGVGDQIPVSTTRADLIIGGDVNISGGTNFSGNTVASPTSTIILYTMTNNNGVPGQPLRGTPIDFAAEEQLLQQLSQGLGGLAATGTATVNFGQLNLEGTGTLLNIFNIDGTNVAESGLSLEQLNGLNIIAPLGSTILVNIAGEDVGFGSYQIFRNGAAATRSDAQFILYNFYQATVAFNQNINISGSVLAPFGDWLALGFGNIDGTLVAQSLTNVTGSLEGHNVIFAGCLPDVFPASTTTTTTSTTTTTTTTPVPTTTTSTTTTTTTASTTTTTTSGLAVIEAVKTASVSTAVIGEPFSYNIIIRNVGTLPGEAFLQEVLTNNVFFIPGTVTVNGTEQTRLDPQAGFSLGILSPGQAASVSFQVVVPNLPESGQIVNRGNVILVTPGAVPGETETIIPGTLPVIPSNNQVLITPVPGVTVEFPTPPAGTSDPIQSNPTPIENNELRNKPHLIIMKSSNVEKGFVGERISYLIMVFNDSIFPSHHTILRDSIPKDATFLPGSVVINATLRLTINPEDGIDLGLIRPNEGVIVEFEILAESPGKIINEASVTGKFIIGRKTIKREFKSNPVKSLIFPLQNRPLISFRKSAKRHSTGSGESIDYTLNLTNVGTVTATDFIIFDPLPSSVSYIPGTIRVNGVKVPDPIVGLPVGNFVPNQSLNVFFSVLIDPAARVNTTANQAVAIFNFQHGEQILPGAAVTNRVVTQINALDEE